VVDDAAPSRATEGVSCDRSSIPGGAPAATSKSTSSLTAIANALRVGDHLANRLG
jgi:hypothetical protein